MTLGSNRQAAIIRTERGLTISGTRITLYDVMDYVTAQHTPKFIQDLFNLSEDQITAALDYIRENYAEVDAEYKAVLSEAAKLQKYYEEENRELIAKIAKMPPPQGQEAAWEKLQAQKAKLQAKLQAKQKSPA
jgi:uncharacterized protein (DUF433 family)